MGTMTLYTLLQTANIMIWTALIVLAPVLGATRSLSDRRPGR